MDPASPHPGGSSRKRRAPDIGGSSTAYTASGGAEDSDGSWEDADSTDEEKLSIDEPKKKKVCVK
jgi:hypothetical protein